MHSSLYESLFIVCHNVSVTSYHTPHSTSNAAHQFTRDLCNINSCHHLQSSHYQ